MARPLTEEGNGAPSLRPLWMLLPYLWPKGQPDLRVRVIVFARLPGSRQSARRQHSPLFYGLDRQTASRTSRPRTSR